MSLPPSRRTRSPIEKAGSLDQASFKTCEVRGRHEQGQRIELPRPIQPARDLRVDDMSDWGDGDFVDRIWEKGRSQIAFAARRDAARLRELYPSTDRRFLRLRIDRAGEAIGWAVLLDTQLAGHKHFGNMRLGSLVDGFTLPGEERHVVHAATRFLHRRGVDLLVSNQSASAWRESSSAAASSCLASWPRNMPGSRSAWSVWSPSSSTSTSVGLHTSRRTSRSGGCPLLRSGRHTCEPPSQALCARPLFLPDPTSAWSRR